MTNNIHWCRNCNQAGVPTTACSEVIPKVSFGDQDSNADKIYILKEHLNGIINTVSNMRYGSADKKQFNATLEYNLNKALESQKAHICQIIKEHGHQQEDESVWCNMDELLDVIKNGKPCDCPKGGFYSDGSICEKCDGTEYV